MAIVLKTDYRKTLGLPGYSSHSFSASVEVEINKLEDAPREIQELYAALQHNVDSQIQVPGFIPPDTYGMDSSPPSPPQQRNATPSAVSWKCSPKQKELILKLTVEKGLTKQEVEQKAQQFFHKGVTRLNKLEASGLIDMLFEIGSTASSRKGGKQ